MSFIDAYLFQEPEDRLTICDDYRTYVRLPARALRHLARTVWLVTTCSWTNILIPFTLLAITLDHKKVEANSSFWISYMALLHISGPFRYATEVLSVASPAIRLVWSFTLGPFSPDVEVKDQALQRVQEYVLTRISQVAFIALCYGHVTLVNSYIVGKVSTTLFATLGYCFMAGGVRRISDTWNMSVVYTMNALLVTAVVPYILVSALGASLRGSASNDGLLEALVSRSASFMLIALFICYQLFRRTHSARFERNIRAGTTPRTMRKIGNGAATILLLGTVTVAYVCALPIFEATVEDLFHTQQFIGFCLLPVLGELADLFKITSLAYRGEMDLSVEVAATTSIHTLLLMAPIFCLSAWYMDKPMGLHIGEFQSVVLFCNIWFFSLLTRRPESNYMYGTIITGLYIIETLAFFLYPNSDDDADGYASPWLGPHYFNAPRSR